MLIDYIALAQYDLEGSVTLTKVPIHESDETQGFVYKSSSGGLYMTDRDMVIVITLRYHNTLESTDPYYRVTTFFNSGIDNAYVQWPANSYVYRTNIQDGTGENYFMVFCTQDDEVLCSLPEADTLRGDDVPVAQCYYDYDFWRISTKYMPNLIPAN